MLTVPNDFWPNIMVLENYDIDQKISRQYHGFGASQTRPKDSETLGLQGILELAKRAAQTVISNPSQTGTIRKGRRHRNGGSHPYSGKGNGGDNSGNNAGGGTVPDRSSKNRGGHGLTSREKGFLQANIDGGEGK